MLEAVAWPEALIPKEVFVEELTARTSLNAWETLTTYMERIARLVAVIVGKDIGKLVEALLVETDNALLEIGV